MPLDHYVTLGRSGLRVSPYCLGAMTFGDDWGWGSTVPDAEAIVTRYIEHGGNFLDTANVLRPRVSSSAKVLTVPSTRSLRAPAPSGEAGVLAQAATAPRTTVAGVRPRRR